MKVCPRLCAHQTHLQSTCVTQIVRFRDALQVTSTELLPQVTSPCTASYESPQRLQGYFPLRKRTPLGPYRRPMRRVLVGS